MPSPKLLIVVPVFNHFDYAAKVVVSALQRTTGVFEPTVVVVDDASPDRRSFPGKEAWNCFQLCLRDMRHLYGEDRVRLVLCEENFGLTHAWNVGLQTAREGGFDACCVTNSDVIFTKDWDAGVYYSLRKASLVGPVTNAPGNTHSQYVGRYSIVYDKAKKDDADHINDVARELYAAQHGRTLDVPSVNGFCMAAWTKTWWDNAHDADHVFKPRNDYYVNGAKNPDPLNEAQEDEFQRRLTAAGGTVGVALDSYVYHYRAVSRGDQHRKGDWARHTNGTSR